MRLVVERTVRADPGAVGLPRLIDQRIHSAVGGFAGEYRLVAVGKADGRAADLDKRDLLLRGGIFRCKCFDLRDQQSVRRLFHLGGGHCPVIDHHGAAVRKCIAVFTLEQDGIHIGLALFKPCEPFHAGGIAAAVGIPVCRRPAVFAQLPGFIGDGVLLRSDGQRELCRFLRRVPRLIAPFRAGDHRLADELLRAARRLYRDRVHKFPCGKGLAVGADLKLIGIPGAAERKGDAAALFDEVAFVGKIRRKYIAVLRGKHDAVPIGPARDGCTGGARAPDHVI